MSSDPIDALVEQWQRERPGLDARPMATVGRLLRAARRVDEAIESQLAGHGLQVGWFDVLSALRRAGAPHRLTPGQLTRALMLSTGGMTKRLDRMQDAGLVERTVADGDRRSVLVALTPHGLTLIDRVVEDHLANEERLLRDLTQADRTRLERLLARIG